MKNPFGFVALIFALWATLAQAQMPMLPPAFMGGVPGMSQFQAIQLQRHQARTLLYREALAELRKNPRAADLPDCPVAGAPETALCLARAKAAGAPAADGEATAAPGRDRHALLIGSNDYRPPIPGLETPIADIEKIATMLRERFGYSTTLLKNAGKAQIIEAMNRIAAEAHPRDSILVFYAGHGYLLEEIGMGFWIPVDASVKSASGWISNSDIAKLLSAIPARQLILISDSCFSGTLAKEQKMRARNTLNTDEVLRRRSVLVLTSGDDEPVTDEGKEGHSIFAWSLLRALRETEGVTPGYEIYRAVHGEVVRDYPQEPQYGAVLSAGHSQDGEYLFESRRR